MSRDIHSGAKLRPREPRGFQGLHRVSPNPNIYNNLGNLLSLKQQPRWLEQMEFGHSYGTAEKLRGVIPIQSSRVENGTKKRVKTSDRMLLIAILQLIVIGSTPRFSTRMPAPSDLVRLSEYEAVLLRSSTTQPPRLLA